MPSVVLEMTVHRITIRGIELAILCCFDCDAITFKISVVLSHKIKPKEEGNRKKNKYQKYF